MPKAHRIIPRMSSKDISRFWVKVDRTSPLGCWQWTASRSPLGYGQFGIGGGVAFLAHRVSWVIANGAIPPGMCVCHRCDVPACVNPIHLFLATHEGNSKDMVRKGRARGGGLVGERHGAAKVTDAQVRAIRARYAAGGITQRELGMPWGLTQRGISNIIRRRTWVHVK